MLAPYYIVWALFLGRRFLRRRHTTVYALGLETAFPLASLRFLHLTSIELLIFDDADRFSLLARVRALQAPLQRIERWTQRHVDVHMIPGRGRYPDGLHARVTAEVPNMPSSATVAGALRRGTVLPRRLEQSELRVLLSGWISDSRGLRMTIAAASLVASRIELYAAGRCSDSDRDALAAAGAIYLGELPQIDALAICREVDVVLTLYDPTTPINRFAESNKWGDCIAMTTPFIVNSEVETARHYVSRGCAWAVPFGDASALAGLLDRLASHPCLLRSGHDALCEVANGQQETFESTLSSIFLHLATDGA
jgi:hypothetical protein